MSNNEITVKCSKCNTPLEGPSNPKPNDIISCPKCGNSDKFNNIMKEIEKQAAAQIENMVADTLDKATRGNKNLKFTRSRHR